MWDDLIAAWAAQVLPTLATLWPLWLILIGAAVVGTLLQPPKRVARRRRR